MIKQLLFAAYVFGAVYGTEAIVLYANRSRMIRNLISSMPVWFLTLGILSWPVIIPPALWAYLRSR